MSGDASPSPASPLEQFFLGLVSAELGVSPDGIPNTERVLTALRSAFREPLTDEEKKLAAADSGAPAGGPAVNRSLSLRIQSALGRAIAAATGRAREAVRPPHVILVADGAVSGEEGSVAATLSATLESSVSAAWDGASDENPAGGFVAPKTLVLAGSSAVNELEQQDSVVVGGRRKPLVFGSAPKGGAAGARDSIHVVEIPGTLEVESAFDPWKEGGAAKVPVAPRSADPGSLVGKTIDDKYEIVREIGRGGFGSVCEAIDRSIGAKVAIKFLNPQVARSRESLEAFKAEAKRVTDLEHPNIVGWKTFGETDDGMRYFVMEFLQGDDLEKAIKKEKDGRLRPRRAARILLQTLDALRKAHGKKILHLDLKPKNVFLVPGEGKRDAQDFVKIIDFGIGQHVGGAGALSDAESSVAPAGNGSRRGTGTVPVPQAASPRTQASSTIKRCTGCTPEYASPEQCGHMMAGVDPVELDGRSDLYSLGVMAFQMLTGRLPFDPPPKEKRRDWYRLHREVPPRKVRAVNSKVPRPLAAFVDRCLAKSPDDRFADTDEAFESLDRYANPPLIKTAAKMTGLASIPLIAMAIVVILFFIPEKPFGLTLAGRKLDKLFLGPERPEVRLDAGDIGVDLGSVTPLLVWADNEKRPNVSVQWETGAGVTPRLVLSAVDGDGFFGKAVQVGLEAGFGKVRLSELFEVSYLGKESWTVEGVDVGAADGMSIDPVDGEAVVRVRDGAGKLTDVRLSGGGVPLTKKREETRDGHVSAGFDLSPLRDKSGPVVLEAVVTDAAQRSVSFSASVNVNPNRIEVEELIPVGCKIEGGSEIYVSGLDPLLRVRTNVVADLEWTAHDVPGSPADMASSKDDAALRGRTEFEVPLKFAQSLAVNEMCRMTLSFNDRRYTSRRRDERRTLEKTFTLRVVHALDPAFDVSEGARKLTRHTLAGASPGDGALYFTTANQVGLNVRLGEPVESWVVPHVRGPGDREPRTLEPVRMVRRYVDLSLPTEAQGLYFARLDLYRTLVSDPPAGPGADRKPERTFEIQVVKDVSPASVEVAFDGLSPRESGPVVVSDPAGILRFRVGSTDAFPEVGGEAPPNPIDVRWKLRRKVAAKGDHAVDLPPEWASGSPVVPGTPRTIDLSLAEWAPISPDGEYTLEASGTDASGQAAQCGSVSWIVATEGPLVEIEIPDPARTNEWRDPWDVRVSVEDPNGVASVSCLVVDKDASQLRSCEVPLTQVDSETWSGSAHDELQNYGWANSVARVRVVAKDRYGKSGSDECEIKVEATDAHRPESVRAKVGEKTDLGRLKLVDGNENEAYVCGGRKDEVESDQWLRAKLPEKYNPAMGGLPKSWNETLDAGSIEPYYLSECEVTCAQFLAFLDAVSRGEANVTLEPERLKNLGDDLRRRNGNVPVTSVRWSEAAMYAQWAGMRLPTYVEWEYAVRGGSQYRLYSCDPKTSPPARGPMPFEGLVVSTTHPSLSGPRPVGESGDVTPVTGIRDLCGNVSEWTASPSIDRRAAPERIKAALLSPVLPAGDGSLPRAFLVAGSNFETFRRFDFSSYYQMDRDRADERTGFRCAISLEDVLEAIKRADTTRAHFEIEKIADRAAGGNPGDGKK